MIKSRLKSNNAPSLSYAYCKTYLTIILAQGKNNRGTFLTEGASPTSSFLFVLFFTAIFLIKDVAYVKSIILTVTGISISFIH